MPMRARSSRIHASRPSKLASSSSSVARQARGVGFYRRAVGQQNVGQQHGVQQAVVQVMASAQRVGQGVDPAKPLLECHCGAGRGYQHAFPGGEVVAVAHGVFQVLPDQAHAFQGDARRHRMVERREQRLQVMGEGVHAGGGAQRRRQPAGQARVEEYAGGQQLAMADDPLDAQLRVGQHRLASQFRAGAGGRGQRQQRRQAEQRVVGEGRIAAQRLGPFEAFEAVRIAAEQGDSLAASRALPPPERSARHARQPRSAWRRRGLQRGWGCSTVRGTGHGRCRRVPGTRAPGAGAPGRACRDR